MTITTLPEEILNDILGYCFTAPSGLQKRFKCFSKFPAGTSLLRDSTRGRLAPLLVCRTFYRIGTPLLYHTIYITSHLVLQRLLTAALQSNPSLVTYIRRLILPRIWPNSGQLLHFCGSSLRSLDVTLDVQFDGLTKALSTEEFGDSLMELNSLSHITIRITSHDNHTDAMLSQIGNVMSSWSDIRFVDLAFNVENVADSLPNSQTVSGTSLQQEPLKALICSLRTRPKLHTFSVLFPSKWNDDIFQVSKNPSLQTVILGPLNKRYYRQQGQWTWMPTPRISTVLPFTCRQ